MRAWLAEEIPLVSFLGLNTVKLWGIYNGVSILSLDDATI